MERAWRSPVVCCVELVRIVAALGKGKGETKKRQKKRRAERRTYGYGLI